MIPFLDLRAQYREIGQELEAAVIETLRSGQYALGPSVEAFEAAFARFCGVRHAVAVNSGTSALHLALLAAGIGPGDEVVTTPMTFVATAAAIIQTGARPVFVDIDPDTWNIDPRRIDEAITPRTRAIVPVHLHGRLADMEAILRIARRRGLAVIEDAAQAHGAARDGRRAGAFGDLGCFSFYPGKNLGACGEGGAVVTDRDDHAELLRSLRDWGQQGRYNHVRQGFNYRMDAIQGAALLVKLSRLERWTEARRAVANAYHAALDPGIARAKGPFGEDHACHVYAIRVPERAAVQAALAERGVATGVHYPVPVHLQPAYAGLGRRAGDFPEAEALARETLSLPIYPEMSGRDMAEAARATNAVAATAVAKVA